MMAMIAENQKYGIIRKLARWLIIDENNIWGFLWGKLCQWVWSFKKTKWSFTVHCVLPNHQQCQLHSSGTESWEKYICRKQHWSLLLSFGWRIFIEVRDTKMHLQKYADVWWRFEQVKKRDILTLMIILSDLKVSLAHIFITFLIFILSWLCSSWNLHQSVFGPRWVPQLFGETRHSWIMCPGMDPSACQDPGNWGLWKISEDCTNFKVYCFNFLLGFGFV